MNIYLRITRSLDSSRDTWLRNTTLREQYPSLYNILQQEEVYVSNVMSHNLLNVTIMQTLIGNK
jgi:hypothetical protein